MNSDWKDTFKINLVVSFVLTNVFEALLLNF